MEYCGPRGIAHSVFLSWDDDDQDDAIAWMQDQQDICGNCGTRQEDWLDEEGHELRIPKLEPHDSRCYGCKSRAEYQTYLDDEGANPNGLYIHFVPTYGGLDG